MCWLNCDMGATLLPQAYGAVCNHNMVSYQ
jgi:hypothetical protein